MGRVKTGIGCAVVAVAAGMFAAGGAQAATVTVGSPLTGSFNSSFGGVTTEVNIALPEAGAQVASPVTGTVVRWRAIVANVGPLALRVIRPTATGGGYLGAGTSPATVTASGTQTFPANLPIQAGDLIGVDISSIATKIEAAASQPGATVREWAPPLQDGASPPPFDNYSSTELGYNADVRYCLVPSLKGKKLGAARQALAEAGCSAGALTKPKGGKKGPVKSQSVAPGTSLPDGAPVALKLRKKRR